MCVYVLCIMDTNTLSNLSHETRHLAGAPHSTGSPLNILEQLKTLKGNRCHEVYLQKEMLESA